LSLLEMAQSAPRAAVADRPDDAGVRDGLLAVGVVARGDAVEDVQWAAACRDAAVARRRWQSQLLNSFFSSTTRLLREILRGRRVVSAARLRCA